jgi:hypothetical protein
MEIETGRRPSQLFTLRVWQEELSAERTEWRGQLRHVASGQTHYFRDWQALTTLLPMLLENRQPPHEAGSSVDDVSAFRSETDDSQP